jgi:hypothetical protein
MREFILIDLQTQMPYLPQAMRDWPRERILAWLRVWGEVRRLVDFPWYVHSPNLRSDRKGALARRKPPSLEGVR